MSSYTFGVGNAALAGRLIARDQSAFAEMYGEYADRVYGVCAAILRDGDDAADAMHDTFVLAIQRIDQLRDPDRLRPWLFAIARHVCFRRLEQRKRVVPAVDVDLVRAEAEEEAEREFGSDEAAALLRAAAQGLNDRDRAVLALHLQEGLDGEELAAALGVRHANPYSLVHRARAQLDRAVGALIIARLGREDCSTLSVLLADWNGTLTPLVRKRLARHLDGCDACKRTNTKARRISVLASLALTAAAPAQAMPAGDLFEIASRTPASKERWLPDGFPPSVDESPRRRRLVLAAIGLGVLGALALVAGVASGTGSPKHQPVVVTPVATVTPSVPSRSANHTPSAPGVTTTATPTTVAGGVSPTTARPVASATNPPVTVGGGPTPTQPVQTPVTPKPAPPTTAKPSPPTTPPKPVTTTTEETVFTF